MKIAVYYIVTDAYKQFFTGFLESLHNLVPDAEKEVMLICDGTELDNYDGYSKDNVSVHLCPKINHYPWPIIALYKHWHILQNWNTDADYACYFNANAIINPNTFVPSDKLITSYHSFNGKDRNYDPWQYVHISKASSAYLENNTYEYIQTAFFFGPASIMHKMCSDCVSMLFADTSRHIFAQWHDESYTNKWCVLNKDLVEKRYLMSVYKNAIDQDTFIYLKNKGELVNDIKLKNIHH